MAQKTVTKKRAAKTQPREFEDDVLAANSVLKPWVRRRELVHDKPLPLIREALLLNERAYDVVIRNPSPMKRGFVILLVILAIVVVAQLIGFGLGLLTTPRVDILSDRILETVTQFGWYMRLSNQNPEFDTNFTMVYGAAWQLFRIAYGFPSTTGTVASIVSVVFGTLFGWLSYGLLAHWIARWFGGKATPYQFYAALGLSYAPLVLIALELIPGFRLPWLLITFLVLIARFQAVKSTYDLSAGYSLAAIIAPYVITAVLIVSLVLLGVAIGLNQIPLLDQILRWFVI